MKTAVDAVFVGKERAYNRRFAQMCAHHLVEPVACTPAAGWEKGQVENQVGVIRQRLFTPRLRFQSYDELNAWLLDQCIVWAPTLQDRGTAPSRSSRPHDLGDATPRDQDRVGTPAVRGRTVEPDPLCRPVRRLPCRAGPAPWRQAAMGAPATVSKTCLVRFDTNKYSVSASAVGRPVEIRAYADRVEFRQDGTVVGEHRRVFGRDQTVFDPWHYVPVLARKPGALRNGAPFKDWVLPASLERVRRKLAKAPRGDRRATPRDQDRVGTPGWSTS